MACTNGRSYSVQPGDTLYSIAQTQLGDGNRWTEIKNPDGGAPNPGSLDPGQELCLPGRSITKSQTVIMAYTGAYPGGRPAPDLSTVPVSSDANFAFIFVLAFARDINRDGIFQPVWDENINPNLIARLKQDNGNRFFYASLGGGDNFPWQTPPDRAAWIRNAISSLSNLIDTYHLDGFDIDYEGGLDGSFVDVMSQVIQGLVNNRNSGFTLAPFGQTWQSYYKPLYGQNSTWISFINYQAYADGLDRQGYMNLYATLAKEVHVYGYGRLGLGIASSTQDPRGLQPPDIYTVWDSLHISGVECAMIWCLEDSASNTPPFAIESAIQQRS